MYLQLARRQFYLYERTGNDLLLIFSIYFKEHLGGFNLT